MNDFRFRAFDTRIGKMYPYVKLVWNGGIEARLVETDPYTIKDITIEHLAASHDDYSENYVKVMMYIWKKDRKGKEMASGDIIIHTNSEANHSPVLIPDVSIDTFDIIASIGDGEWEATKGVYDNIEIIGNKWENPEINTISLR